jgi:hypothetical protein
MEFFSVGPVTTKNEGDVGGRKLRREDTTHTTTPTPQPSNHRNCNTQQKEVGGEDEPRKYRGSRRQIQSKWKQSGVCMC